MTYHSAPGILSEQTMEEIAAIISDRLGVTLDQMKSKNRKRQIVEARQISMYFMYRSKIYSLKSIGDFFGGKDHTTVLHSIKQVKIFMETEPQFDEKMKDISYALNIPLPIHYLKNIK